MTDTNPSITLLIPAYNEIDTLPTLIKEINQIRAQLAPLPIDCLIVNDGSTDTTATYLAKCSRNSTWLSSISLSKNYGHQIALAVGLQQAKGDAVIMMDADLQHPPKEIPRMIAAFKAGYPIVQMARQQAVKGKKGLLSKGFYQFINRLTSRSLTPNAADFRLLSRSIVDELNSQKIHKKLCYRALIPNLGHPIYRLVYQEKERHAGKPAYTFLKSLHLAINAMSKSNQALQYNLPAISLNFAQASIQTFPHLSDCDSRRTLL